MPRYADYHRTVVGYHGTRRSTALRIVQGEAGFEPSENGDDWLGHGIYFWEYAPQQAWLWAKQRSRDRDWEEEIAVVASMIRLGYCLDLLDPEHVKQLGRFHQEYVREMQRTGQVVPANVMSKKWLNCAVFQFAYSIQEDPIDTCRAVFVPTTKADRIWKGSGINAHAHIQICVRNPDCILGTWLVKPVEEEPDGDAETIQGDEGDDEAPTFDRGLPADGP